MALHVHVPDEGSPAPQPNAQPAPIEVRVCPSPDGKSTAIYRKWPRGTTGPGGLCRFCETCFAYNDACLLTIPEVVTRHGAARYSTRARGFDVTGS